MFPHEAQAIMAKILFFVFATCILCMRPINSAELKSATMAKMPTESVVTSLKH